jgi:tetratricopeptide (TPR) repeat protein
MKNNYLFIAIFIFSTSLFASPKDMLLQGNQLYNNGKYLEALKIYQAIQSQGMQDETLLFNMGNAHYRVGELGNAILFWEKALKYFPRSTEARENLIFARKQNNLPPITSHNSIIEMFKKIGIQEFAILFSIIFILMITAIVFSVFKHNNKLLSLKNITFIITICIFTILLYMRWSLFTQPWGIAIGKNILVKSGPADTNATLFQVQEGVGIRIERVNGHWYQVTVPGKLSGWVEKKSIGKI